MELKLLKKTGLFLIIAGTISTASAQVYSKIGEHPGKLNNSAVFELESKSRGFLPPRMNKGERDKIASPAVGLQVWCTDCNVSTTPVSGELSVYIGTGWASFGMLNSSPPPPPSLLKLLKVSTGKRADSNRPVRNSATSVTIKGILESVSENLPTETGVVYREITGNDFAVLPVLYDTGIAIPPNYKMATPTPVTTAGDAISVDIDLSSAGSGKRPFSFRTYAKDPSGIVYGNPVVFNAAPPAISDPVVTGGDTSFPTFGGTLTVNAGTSVGAITDYGYCSSTTNNLPTTNDNKVILSTSAPVIAALDINLNADSFTSDSTIDLPVKGYEVKTLGINYFRYYVVANGVTTYSPVASFSPAANTITGGTAIAEVISVENLVTPVPFQTNLKGSGTIKVNFNVTKAGTYAGFEPKGSSGATKGLTMGSVPAGSFAIGNQSLTFTVSGTPVFSTEGNSFMVSRIPIPLKTGPIEGARGRALCDGTNTSTTIVDITSATGKVWMDRNLGASRKGQTTDDYEAYGCLFQWGRGNDGHASMNWTSSTTGEPINATTNKRSDGDKPGDALFITPGWHINWRSSPNNSLWQEGGNGGINNPCPNGYHVPSNTDFYLEFVNNGIQNIWSGFNKLGLVASGYRSATDGSISGEGHHGSYWTSTPNGGEYIYATFDTANVGAISTEISMGLAVRCVKNQ